MIVQAVIRVELDDYDGTVVDAGELIEQLLYSMGVHILSLAEWAPKPYAGRPRDSRDSAVVWLKAYLSNGAKPAMDVQEAAAQANISPRTLRRAADEVVKKSPASGPHTKWKLR